MVNYKESSWNPLITTLKQERLETLETILIAHAKWAAEKIQALFVITTKLL